MTIHRLKPLYCCILLSSHFHIFKICNDVVSSVQIVLTVSQTMWCRDITECLISEGDRLEAMKDAEQMCVQVFQLLCMRISRGIER